MSKKLLIILACCLLATGGCNIFYKQNIQQGNAIEQEKLDQLKLGMTMNQVAFLMGTPAVRDPFHQNRWDYYYSFAVRGGDPLTRLVTLRFENAILTVMKGIDFDDQDAVVSKDTDKSSELGVEETTEGPVVALAESVMEPGPQTPDTVSEAGPEPVTPEPLITAIESPVSKIRQVATGTAEDNAHRVQAEVVLPEEVDQDAPEDEPVTPAAEESPAVWAIQLGAFDSFQNAQNLVERMQLEGFQGSITQQEIAHLETRYLVRTQGYESRDDAEQQLEKINSALEMDAFLVPPSK